MSSLSLKRFSVGFFSCAIAMIGISPARSEPELASLRQATSTESKSVGVSRAVPVSPRKTGEGINDNLILSEMDKELDRSISKLKGKGAAPMYFLCYRIHDTSTLKLSASYGALSSDQRDHSRSLDVEARVGTPRLDSSHKMSNSSQTHFQDCFSAQDNIQFPTEDDRDAIRNALWLATDSAFKSAQRDYVEVKADRTVKVNEEDQSPDFSAAPKIVNVEKPVSLEIDSQPWKDRLRRLSSIYKSYPDITTSFVELNADYVTRYIANTEGTRIQTTDRQVRLLTSATAVCKDGMVVHLYDSVDVLNASDLPDESKMEKRIRSLAQAVIALKNAKPAEPYAGPAILRCRAAGVFFHEVLGHRIEGHRQKDEEEGRTFAKKVNEKIMPDFISVSDDPTLSRLGNQDLAGHYRFDDEGVKAQKVAIVEHGVLKNFLMGRSPINNFNQSNGHSRASAGSSPVARQGNLIVTSTKVVPYKELRAKLVGEAKRQGKPYGLVFDEIAGGFAVTQVFMPQMVALLPLRVTRVWVDGRPDELLRGVSLDGTPLASLETIMCAADDCATFNGVCGAESGWVPVSATSPSLLVRTIEVARNPKGQSKPPLLPPPPCDQAAAQISSSKESL